MWKQFLDNIWRSREIHLVWTQKITEFEEQANTSKIEYTDMEKTQNLFVISTPGLIIEAEMWIPKVLVYWFWNGTILSSRKCWDILTWGIAKMMPAAAKAADFKFRPEETDMLADH